MLGIYPSWQYSADPAINPKINPHVQYPDGVYQTTVQPLGPYYGGDLSGPHAGPQVKLLGVASPLFQMGGHGMRLMGNFGISSGKPAVSLMGIADSVGSIGTFIILGLAAYGGWNVYKRVRGK